MYRQIKNTQDVDVAKKRGSSERHRSRLCMGTTLANAVQQSKMPCNAYYPQEKDDRIALPHGGFGDTNCIESYLFGSGNK